MCEKGVTITITTIPGTETERPEHFIEDDGDFVHPLEYLEIE